MKQAYDCIITKKDELIPGIFDFTVENENIAKNIVPGQFLHIDCGGRQLLRRPISICDSGEQSVRFIFEVKGGGTKALSKKKIGESISILGPLGNGFHKLPGKYPVIIGGGIGVFPLYKLTKTICGCEVILGFRSADRIVMEDEFKTVCSKLSIATDDGSKGYKGYAVDILKERIAAGRCDSVYACGPAPMLKSIKEASENAGIACLLSLEQRMGCGIGACLVCTCETVFEGSDKQKRVCKDGPVFDSKEVTLNA